ncbi:MAG TPA: sodium-independent anion transporter, partial [Treponema sp.]|nr:sodium-independent anion transporter [Treponema sp.]
AEIKPGNVDIGSEILYGHSDRKSAENAAIPEHSKNIEVYEITGPFFFGVADTLQRTLRSLSKKPRAFVLRMRDVPAVDSTGINALEAFLDQCRRGKIRLILCELRAHPFSALKKAGFIDEIGAENITATLEDALKTG